MKHAILRRLVSAAAAACLLLSAAGSAFAATPERYVALGDSITFGYAPGGTEEEPKTVDHCFVDQLASSLGISDYENLSEVGATSADLLAAIEEHSAELAGAGLITITIGGNDLMNALYDYLYGCYKADHPDTPLDAAGFKAEIIGGNTAILQAVAGDLPGFGTSPQAGLALASFSSNLAKAITQLKLLAPNAQIIVANQYNPYQYLQKNAHAVYGSMSALPVVQAALDQIDTLTAAFDLCIVQLNRLLSTGSQGGALYTLADLYSAFADAVQADADPCNAAFSLQTGLDLDFHPNQTGHDLIARTLAGPASHRAALSASAAVFAPLTEGYDDPSGILFTLANTGSADLDNLTVLLSDSEHFAVSGPDATTAAAGGAVTFTVTPKTGLGAGSYPVTVSVRADGLPLLTRLLSLEVKEASYALSVTGGSITADGAATTATEFVAGTEITLTADAPAAGTHFAGWTLEGVTVDPADGQTISFAMPAGAVTATAAYAPHTPASEDGDCTTPVLCTVCGAVVSPAQQHELVHHEGKAPTHSASGWAAYDTCANPGCSYTTYQALAPDYVILDDAGNPAAEDAVFTAASGSALTVRASGNCDQNFLGIEVDGAAVEPDRYEVKAGSTIVTLRADYLDTLARGDHLLTFVYADGSASAAFRLTEKADVEVPATETTPALPQTGEGDGLMLSVAAAVLSLSALAALVTTRRTRRG